MDMERSPSDVGSGGAGSSAVRKDRGVIAAQACERCRARKQRCDELRPKCSTCNRLKVDCIYRTPVPTKKDNTLLEILKKLNTVEKKIDDLGSREPLPRGREAALLSHQSISSTVSGGYGLLPETGGPRHQPVFDNHTSSEGSVYTPSTKVMLEWPVMQHISDASGSKGKNIESRAPPYQPTMSASGIGETDHALNIEGLVTAAFSTGSSTPASFVYPDPRVVPQPVVPVLAWETVQPLSKGYFDTFNLLYPIVDEQWFMNHTVGDIMSGVENTAASALAFLVLALGEVALASSTAPISQMGGRASGIKGGTVKQPPGLEFFNEARKRLGLFLTEVSIENLQVLSLTALFYASCGRAGDCWRMAAFATVICQDLASRVHEAQASHDLIRRLFWHCSSMTFCLRAEFHLPMTDLEHLSAFVGLPHWAGGQSEEDYLANHTSQFRDYAQSQIFVHRLMSGLYTSLENFRAIPTPPFSTSAKTPPSTETIRDKAQYYSEQLERWKGLLPAHLAWRDGQSLGFSPDGYPAHVLIGSNLGDATMAYPYISIMQIALLRSQYCHIKYLIYRFYVYKALHHPDSLTEEDYVGAGECLKASLKWPITMAPPSTNKRLIPLPFYWSQNICGVLVLLHLSQHHHVLSHIRVNYCGQHFDFEATETVDLYIQWLQDMKQIDATTERCWKIIAPLYRLRE